MQADRRREGDFERRRASEHRREGTPPGRGGLAAGDGMTHLRAATRIWGKPARLRGALPRLTGRDLLSALIAVLGFGIAAPAAAPEGSPGGPPPRVAQSPGATAAAPALAPLLIRSKEVPADTAVAFPADI